ncbi:hypothetical protein BHAOGJBA_5177 [Methylobacterium hispanicum]|uniref:Uncharacterized protein n=1 Tax=Methylobacterium hispanicum TaxID=270350 RepID=A0AAV4ZU02_9HYPH|nr:hypothetical protein [Methylobacterium hispanicum]GJD91629.1 hypothetical protein BHAOGJBA_5177 [Methylobacterium hispanicum]
MISGSVVIAFIGGSIAVGGLIAGLRILAVGASGVIDPVPARVRVRPEIRVLN